MTFAYVLIAVLVIGVLVIREWLMQREHKRHLRDAAASRKDCDLLELRVREAERTMFAAQKERDRAMAQAAEWQRIAAANHTANQQLTRAYTDALGRLRVADYISFTEHDQVSRVAEPVAARMDSGAAA